MNTKGISLIAQNATRKAASTAAGIGKSIAHATETRPLPKSTTMITGQNEAPAGLCATVYWYS